MASLISRKAQGISMEVIVVAVIALIVLAVLSFIFLGKVGTFGKTASECRAKAEGAECKNNCGKGEIPINGLCEGEELCCIPDNS